MIEEYKQGSIYLVYWTTWLQHKDDQPTVECWAEIIKMSNLYIGSYLATTVKPIYQWSWKNWICINSNR